MSKKTKIIIVCVLLVIALLIYFYWNNPKVEAIKNKLIKPKEITPPLVNNGFVINTPDLSNDNYPLKKGSKGERVKTLQLALNKINEKQGTENLALVPDGSFGPKTEALILKLLGVMFFTKEGLTESNFNAIIEQSNKTTPIPFPGINISN